MTIDRLKIAALGTLGRRGGEGADLRIFRDSSNKQVGSFRIRHGGMSGGPIGGRRGNPWSCECMQAESEEDALLVYGGRGSEREKKEKRGRIEYDVEKRRAF